MTTKYLDTVLRTATTIKVFVSILYNVYHTSYTFIHSVQRIVRLVLFLRYWTVPAPPRSPRGPGSGGFYIYQVFLLYIWLLQAAKVDIYITNKKNTVTNNYPIPKKYLSRLPGYPGYPGYSVSRIPVSRYPGYPYPVSPVKIKKTLPTSTEKSPPSDAKDIDTALLAVTTGESLSTLYKEGLFAQLTSCKVDFSKRISLVSPLGYISGGEGESGGSTVQLLSNIPLRQNVCLAHVCAQSYQMSQGVVVGER